MAIGKGDKEAILADMKRQLEEEREKNEELEQQFDSRVGSFAKRETDARRAIDDLEKKLKTAADEDYGHRMSAIRQLHGNVVQSIEGVQTSTARTLQEQERDLMRAFRARLKDVTTELETQRHKQGDHSAELVARHRRVLKELHASQELAMVFDKKNQALAQENQRLMEKLRTREDDRKCLVKELAHSKRDLQRAQATLESAPVNEQSKSQLFSEVEEDQEKQKFSEKEIAHARLQDNRNRAYERELKYRQQLKELERTLATERRTLHLMHEIQNEKLGERNELEALLRQAVDDVELELEHKQPNVVTDLPVGLTVSGTHQALSAKDRERVLELLLSQSRVIELLYDDDPAVGAQS